MLGRRPPSAVCNVRLFFHLISLKNSILLVHWFSGENTHRKLPAISIYEIKKANAYKRPADWDIIFLYFYAPTFVTKKEAQPLSYIISFLEHAYLESCTDCKATSILSMTTICVTSRSELRVVKVFSACSWPRSATRQLIDWEWLGKRTMGASMLTFNLILVPCSSILWS